MKEFKLTPHIYRILIGRGSRLICERCQMAITVTGYGICKRCKTKTYFEEMQWDEKTRKRINKCKRCGSMNLEIVYTTIVVAKRRRHKTVYYHKECFDELFMEL